MAGLSIEGLEDTLFHLERLGERTNKAALRALRRGTKRIVERAKQYAPVDEGNLEQSIKAIEERFGNDRITVLIGVDEHELGDGYQRWGFRYDVKMHEDYSYNLGPRSRAKQAAIGMRVGPGYLVRALDDYEAGINQDIQNAVRDETR